MLSSVKTPGGLYTGVGEFQNKGTKDEVAVQSMVYSYKQVERCVRYAFESLQLVHKKNSMERIIKRRT